MTPCIAMTFCHSYRTTISIGCIVLVSILQPFIEENGSFKILTRKEPMALSDNLKWVNVSSYPAEINEMLISITRDEVR